MAAGGVTKRVKGRFNLLVEGPTEGARPNCPDDLVLCLTHGGILLSDRLRGGPPHDGSSEVTKIARGFGAREDIDDDRNVGFQSTVASLVRVTALIASRDDRVSRNAASSCNFGMDCGSNLFRGEGTASQIKPAIGLHTGLANQMDARFETGFRHLQRLSQFPDFGRCLDRSLRERRDRSQLDPRVISLELMGEAERKPRRHVCASDPQRLEQVSRDVRKLRPADALVDDRLP